MACHKLIVCKLIKLPWRMRQERDVVTCVGMENGFGIWIFLLSFICRAMPYATPTASGHVLLWVRPPPNKETGCFLLAARLAHFRCRDQKSFQTKPSLIAADFYCSPPWVWKPRSRLDCSEWFYKRAMKIEEREGGRANAQAGSIALLF